MALRNILKYPQDEELLRRVARPVTAFDDHLCEILGDLKDTMTASDGVGLAAPQVGILRRIAVVDVGDGDGLIELINPVITKTQGSQDGAEGCLSVPERHGMVVRPETVTAEYYDRRGEKHSITVSGYRARAFCHEIDHLDGILYIDKARREEE